MDRQFRIEEKCASGSNKALFPSLACEETTVCVGRVVQKCDTPCAPEHPQPACPGGGMQGYGEGMPPAGQYAQSQIGAGMYAGQYSSETGMAAKPPSGGFDDIRKRVHYRTVTVVATFSAKEAEDNSAAACVQVSGDAVFKKKMNLPGGKRSAQRCGETRTMVMYSAKVMSAKNTHKVPLGFRVDGVPGNSFTADGRRFSGVLHSDSMLTFSGGQSIHVPMKFFDSPHFKRYIGLKLENLKAGIEDGGNVFPGTYIVNPKTVAADVLRKNQEVLPFNLRDCGDNQGNYLISKEYMDGLLTYIHDTIVNKMPYTDLGVMKISYHRADTNGRWTDPGGVLREYQLDPEFLQRDVFETPHTVEMQLQIGYMITNIA